MSRQARIEYPGALYHVMAHGNGFQWIYKSNRNILQFFKVLNEVRIKYNFLIHSFVLMRNHYHILLETLQGNLSKGMKKLNRDFANLINIDLNRKGSVFRDRYKAIIIEKENYYFTVLKYIYINPIRNKIVQLAEEYPGSSLYYLNQKNNKWIREILYLEDQIEYFGQEQWLSNLIQWVNDNPNKFQRIKMRYKYILGSDRWIDKIKDKYLNKPLLNDVIDKDKLIKKITFIDNIDEEKIKKALPDYKKSEIESVLIYLYNKYSEITQKDMLIKLGLSNSNTLSKRLNRFKRKLKQDKELQKRITKIEELL